jgi:hypothetical protein
MERKEIQEMSRGKWDDVNSAPIAMQGTLVLGAMRYLPHYLKQGVFVGPGRPPVEYGAAALIAAGAVKETYPLLIRGYF